MRNQKGIFSIFNSLPIASIIMLPDDPTYTIVFANDTFLRETTTVPGQLTGRGFFEAFTINPDDTGDRTKRIIDALQYVLQRKAPHQLNNHRYDMPGPADNEDENVRYWNIDTYPLFDDNGNIQYIVQSSVDVTARRVAELKLQKNHHKLNKVLQSITDGFFVIDKSCSVTYWNNAAKKISGLRADQVLGKCIWNLYPKMLVHDFKEAYLKAEETQAKIRLEQYNEEVKFWYEVTLQPIEEGMSVYFRNITYRKEAEEKTKVTLQRNLDLFNFSPVPMWAYNIETFRFVAANQAAQTDYGYDLEEYLNLTVRVLWPDSELSKMEKQLETKVKTGLNNDGVVKHLTKSGKVIDVQIKSQPLPSWGQNIRIIMALDITDKLAAVEALRTSERRFKTLIQDGSDLITILNENGDYKYVSPTAERILQESAEELIGKNAFENVYGPDREEVQTRFAELDTHRQHQLAPFRMVTSKGEIRWIEATITNLLEDPAIEGIVTNARDVTDRLENELRVTEHLERYNTVSKATSDTIWDANILTGELIWNHGIQKNFGYKAEPWKYERWYEHVHPDDRDRVTSLIAENMQNKEPRWTSEYRFMCADGDYKFVLDRGFLIFNDEGIPVRMIGAMQDITERIKYIHTIEKSNQLLREIGWTQAHLVRSPLSRILGLAELLQHPDTNPEQHPELLEFLQHSARELDQIVRDIIHKSKENLK